MGNKAEDLWRLAELAERVSTWPSLDDDSKQSLFVLVYEAAAAYLRRLARGDVAPIGDVALSVVGGNGGDDDDDREPTWDDWTQLAVEVRRDPVALARTWLRSEDGSEVEWADLPAHRIRDAMRKIRAAYADPTPAPVPAPAPAPTPAPTPTAKPVAKPAAAAVAAGDAQCPECGATPADQVWREQTQQMDPAVAMTKTKFGPKWVCRRIGAHASRKEVWWRA